MPIIDQQRRLVEVGRIRLGEKGDRGQPVKLTQFRLTSRDRKLLEAAADRYGGTVKPWADQPGQFELHTQRDVLPIMIADREVSQWFEHWTGGGCKRRCDGQTETISDTPCSCDPENRECKRTTRFSVILHELPAIGVWRLDTHGYYAAAELPQTVELVGGSRVPMELAIEQRTVKRDGKTKQFIVPVIRLSELSFRQAIEATTPALPGAAAIAPALAAPIQDPDLAQRRSEILEEWEATRSEVAEFVEWCKSRGLKSTQAIMDSHAAGCRSLDEAGAWVLRQSDDDHDAEVISDEETELV